MCGERRTRNRPGHAGYLLRTASRALALIINGIKSGYGARTRELVLNAKIKSNQIIWSEKSGEQAKPTVLEIASSHPTVHARARSACAWDNERGARVHSPPWSRSA